MFVLLNFGIPEILRFWKFFDSGDFEILGFWKFFDSEIL
jgi:hypothetical protein